MVSKVAVPDGTDVPLPAISSHEINVVTDWLYSQERMQRRPEATAKLLILAVKLHKTHSPWPTRPAIAKHLGVSMPLVDVAVSQRRAQGLITLAIETTRGFNRQRVSVVTHRFVVPSDELIKLVEKAEREERRIKRREAQAAGG